MGMWPQAQIAPAVRSAVAERLRALHLQTGQDLLAQLSPDAAANRPAQKWDPRLFGIGD